MLEIFANGSCWVHEKPMPIEALYKALTEHTLDPRYESYGGFINRNPNWINPNTAEKYAGCALLSGNFLDYTHAFNLVTDDEDIISRVEALVAENIKRPDYVKVKGELGRCQNCIFFDIGKEKCLLDKTAKRPLWDCQVGHTEGRKSLKTKEGEREFVSRVTLPEPKEQTFTKELLTDALMNAILEDAGKPYIRLSLGIARDAIYFWMTRSMVPNEEFEAFEKELQKKDPQGLGYTEALDAIMLLASLAEEQFKMEASADIRNRLPADTLKAFLIGTESKLDLPDVLIALADLLTSGPEMAPKYCGDLLEQMGTDIEEIIKIKNQITLAK